MIKIKIDEKGCLWLRRGNELKIQYCPFQSSQIDTPCGDYCPLFGEPYILFDVALKICQDRELRCKIEEFVDERTQKTEKGE